MGIMIRNNQPQHQPTKEGNFCCMYVGKYQMNKEADVERKLEEILANFQLHEIKIPHDIPATDYRNEFEAELMKRIHKKLAADKVILSRNLTLMMLVGNNMPKNTEKIYRASQALANEDINIELIHLSQSAEHICLILGVQEELGEKAIEIIQEEFFSTVSN